MAKSRQPQQSHAAAGKFAQLLGEVIVHHSPWTAKLAATERQAVVDEWLEGMEKHSSGVLGEWIDEVMGSADPASHITTLLENAARPTAQFGSTIQQFFVYGVMFSLASAALAPFTQVLSNALWKANPTRPISPPDIATMVVRGIAPGGEATTPVPQWAIDAAAENGLNSDAFIALVSATGNPPAPQDLYEMIRRGIISEPQLEQGIREGDTRDEWIPYIAKLRYTTPSPVDLVRMAVQNQLPYQVAASLAAQLGLEPAGYINANPDWFQLLYDTNGRPPGPEELGRAANRGITPWDGVGKDAVSFEQGISESDIKDKWIPTLKALAQYFPPIGETERLLKGGGITPDQAIALYQQAGVPADLATAYLHVAQVEQVTQERQETKGEIQTLLLDGILNEDQATAALSQIGYGGDVAANLIALTEFRYVITAIKAGVRKVGTLYAAHKVTATEAQSALQELGLAPPQVTRMLATWDVQRSAEVKVLTEAQILDGWEYAIFATNKDENQGIALSLLAQIGMEPWDAWVALSVKAKGPLPGEPARPASIVP